MSEALWAAVDAITKPTRRALLRDTNGDGVTNIATDRYGGAYCDISAYRAATTHRVTIPSLWDQSTEALATGDSETTDSRPANINARTPIDVELMEIRSVIADTTAHELGLRHLKMPGTVPGNLRRLAAHVVGYDPDQLWWWEYRFQSWARLLGTYLHAQQNQPRPVRLRNAACPECKIRQVVIESDGGPVVAPPLLIDFRGGYVRAAECSGCGAAWFRGDDLHALAALLDPPRAS